MDAIVSLPLKLTGFAFALALLFAAFRGPPPPPPPGSAPQRVQGQLEFPFFEHLRINHPRGHPALALLARSIISKVQRA